PGEVHAAEPDGARRGPLEAGDQVERRGLAGAVGTDEPEDLAGSDREAEVADGLQAPEALAEALDLQQGPGAGATGPRRGQPGPARERRPAPRQEPGDDGPQTLGGEVEDPEQEKAERDDLVVAAAPE